MRLLLYALFVLSASAASFSRHEVGRFYEPDLVREPALRDAMRSVLALEGATGFLVSPDGYVLTCYHVFQQFGASGVAIRGWAEGGDPEPLWLEKVALAPAVDAALYRVADLGVRESPLPALPLRAEAPAVGEPVAVLGHPRGRTLRASFGQILETGFVLDGRPSIEYDAQTLWGSSGSPVLDPSGQVVAMHWGWDAEGKHHGRLTGVPVAELLAALPELREVTGR